MMRANNNNNKRVDLNKLANTFATSQAKLRNIVDQFELIQDMMLNAVLNSGDEITDDLETLQILQNRVEEREIELLNKTKLIRKLEMENKALEETKNRILEGIKDL